MILRCFVAAVVSLVFSMPVKAHPHIAINTHPVFVFAGDYFKGVRITWVWDELFSEQVIIDYDKNESGTFDHEELKGLERFFHNIKDYKYFSEIKINGQVIDEIKIEDFSASINPDEGTVSYAFFIPVNFKLSDSDVNISYISDDPTIYVSFSTKCTASKLDEETDSVDVFDGKVGCFSYYGYKFSIVAHKK